MPDSTIRFGSDESYDDLMRQLRTHPQARPRPFFYGRVRARLASKAAASHPLSAWQRRLTYAALLGALVLSLSGDCSAATTYAICQPALVQQCGPAQASGPYFAR